MCVFSETSKQINKQARSYLGSSEESGTGGVYNKLNIHWQSYRGQ